VAHDIFIDPPKVYKGSQVVVGANVSLFGTRADLAGLAADLGVTELTVRFDLNPIAGISPITVTVPLTSFRQDFGQAVVTTTWDIPAGTNTSLGRVIVTVDPADQLPETRENDNSAARRVRLFNAPPDTTPPTVNLVRISDDDPFNDDDPITSSRDVRVKIQATDGGTPASGVSSFCIVSYFYNVVTRRWVELPCQFQPLPAPETQDTFIVEAELPAREGVAYAFVWVRDNAGNISRRPGFDVISFIPATPINLRRNDVRIFRIPLSVGQSLTLTFTHEFGDVDVSVFDDFTNPNATRIAASARNGSQTEAVTLTGEAGKPNRFQVEVRAVVNSRFAITVAEGVGAAVVTSGLTPNTTADLPENPLVGGPPASQAAIDDEEDVFLPQVVR
jgi:hypothetical protein